MIHAKSDSLHLVMDKPKLGGVFILRALQFVDFQFEFLQ